MAKPPASGNPNLSLVNEVEAWLDQRIPDNSTQFDILVSTIEEKFGGLTEADWRLYVSSIKRLNGQL